MRRGLRQALQQLSEACFANLRLKLVALVLAVVAYLVVHYWAEKKPPVVPPPPATPGPCT